MLKLLVQETLDQVARENMKRLQFEITDAQKILKANWKFFELTFETAVTNFKYPHKLTFTPKDVLQTSLKGTGALTWNYEEFDFTNLDITTTGPCVVRAFIGSYLESAGQL